MKSHPKPETASTEEKAEALRHVLYEIAMMLGCLVRLQKSLPDGFEKNLLLEGALTHARNLDEFFTGQGKDKIPCDLFGFDRRTRVFGTRLSMRINTEITHLCYGRACCEERRNWILPQDLEPLLSIVNEFIDHILDKHTVLQSMSGNLEGIAVVKFYLSSLRGGNNVATDDHTDIVPHHSAGSDLQA